MSVFRTINRHLTVSLFAARPTGESSHGQRAGPERFAGYFFSPAGAAEAVGSGCGLSDLEFRNAITSARSLPRGRPAKLILVPGTKAFGLVRKVLRSSTVQFPPLPFMPAE